MDEDNDYETDDEELDDDIEEENCRDEISEPGDDQRGLVGLQNLGNTCYMNGALQALSNCPQLTRFILDCPGFLHGKGLSQSYSDLIKEIWNPRSKSYAVPTSVIRNIKCIYPAFRGCAQQDTQEFLRCFLEQLHDELKQPVIDDGQHSLTATSSKTSSPIPSSSSSCQQEGDNHEEGGGDHGELTESDNKDQQITTTTNNSNSTNHRSIISDTFEFKISSSVVCSNCNNISTTEETFKDLSIPIPSRDHPYYTENLQSDTISASTSSAAAGTSQTASRGETQTGGKENNLESDKTDRDDDSNTCQEVQKSYLDTTSFARWFWEWLGSFGSWFWGPQVTLKDCLSIFFGTDPLEGDNEYSCEVCTKKNRGVKFLKILELPEVLCIHFKRYESIGSSKITTHVSFPLTGLDLAPFMSENSRPQCTTYNLIACICHHGSALLTGHYTTYALNCYDDQWYEFDDLYVTNVESYQVENSEAYILFYQKSTLDDTTNRQRVKASKLLKKSLGQSDIKKFFISKQWVNKFNTFVEPGPITNYDFLCEHQKVAKTRQPYVSDLCHPISETVWKYLRKLHGGGPECQELVGCDICE